MVMVRFVRVCLAALPMCHPQDIVSRQLTRHDKGNTLKYQNNREGLQALPRNAMECAHVRMPTHRSTCFQERRKVCYRLGRAHPWPDGICTQWTMCEVSWWHRSLQFPS